MSLTKGKFKVRCLRFISDIIIDDRWRKVPEAETVHFVPHASQSAHEHDANTEDPAYHVSLPLPSSCHPPPNILSLVRRVGVIKLKVQLLRPTPHRLPARRVHPRPPFPTSRMPLPPIHPRFARPRVPRPLSVSVPLSRHRRISDNERRLSGYPAPSSQSSRRVPSSTQRVRSSAARDREGD
jgi:hypothetical protein